MEQEWKQEKHLILIASDAYSFTRCMYLLLRTTSRTFFLIYLKMGDFRFNSERVKKEEKLFIWRITDVNAKRTC